MALPDKSGQGPYVYPVNKDPQFKSKMVCQAIKGLPPKFTARFFSSFTADEVSGIDGPASRSATPDQIRVASSGIRTSVIQGENVSLYVPISFNVNDALRYANVELGLAGSTVANVASRGGSIGSGILKALQDTGQSLFDFFIGTGARSETAAVAAARGIQFTPLPGSIQNAVGLTARVTLNPNLRTQFQGVNVRDFAFQFSFFPKNQTESIMVKKIIKFFRYHAYPEELLDRGDFSIAYRYPNLFRIKLLSESNEGPIGANGQRLFKNIGTPIKMSYLTGVQTSYNQVNAVLHPDGSPTQIDLNLVFTEYKALSRRDILNEDDDIFYQFENNTAVDNGTSVQNLTRQSGIS